MKHGHRSDTKARSRALRKEMSPAERRLWSILKARPDGFRFRKQHPCGPYTLDFFCPSRALVVEVDGQAHGHGDRPARDEARDGWLAEQGLLTLRIPAIELVRDLDAVIRYIIATAESRPALFVAGEEEPPPPPA